MPTDELTIPPLDLRPEIEAVLDRIERERADVTRHGAMYVCLGPGQRGCGRTYDHRPDHCVFCGADHRRADREA